MFVLSLQALPISIAPPFLGISALLLELASGGALRGTGSRTAVSLNSNPLREGCKPFGEKRG
jgi:hypothetical protein